MFNGLAPQPCQPFALIRQKFAIVRPKNRHRERFPQLGYQKYAIVNDYGWDGPFTMANYWRIPLEAWHGKLGHGSNLPRPHGRDRGGFSSLRSSK